MVDRFFKTDEDNQQILAHPAPKNLLVEELFDIHNRKLKKEAVETVTGGLFE